MTMTAEAPKIEADANVDDHVVDLMIKRDQLQRQLGAITAELSLIETDTQKAAFKVAFPNK